jgi:DNA methylase
MKDLLPIAIEALARRGVAVEAASQPGRPTPSVAYTTRRGVMYRGFAEDVLRSSLAKKFHKKVQLIFTSPPFPLNNKKKYGNYLGEQYVDWLSTFAPLFKELITADGSIVIEVGNAWEPGVPSMSTLSLETLLKFLHSGEFKLCQQFICYNPARLPSPAKWVTIDRIRVKDSYTHVWWMSSTSHPKADNRRVLKPYSQGMLKLLQRKTYNAGKRPSEHNIGKTSFLTDNDGAIPSNVLTFSNTSSGDSYLRYCKDRNLQSHPARMPADLASFFIKFLTDEGDIVFDPFAGSNTTGAQAEILKRKWISIEPREDYIKGSKGRFSSSYKG